MTRFGWQSQPRDLLGRFGSRADEGAWFDNKMRAFLPLPHKAARYPSRDDFDSGYHLMAREYWLEPMPR